MTPLDHFDRQLLMLLQADAGITSEKLSETIALSASAIQRRIKRLRDDNVIERDVAILSPAKVGNPTYFLVSLQVESERPELLSSLRTWIAAEDQIQQAFYVTGEADFLMIVTAQDTQSFEALMARLLNENVNVKRYSTNVALGIVKRGLTIPV